MTKFEVTVIGGGIVGLATAYQILKNRPGTRLLLLDKESKIAAHQTGHNSGVIHSGIYYKPGSEKARNCITGYGMMLNFVKEHDIPFKLCGKVIVATKESEIPLLKNLYERGLQNNLNEIKLISKEEMNEIEPHVNGLQAIHVPYTGIIDYVQVSEKLGELIQQFGGTIRLNQEVKSINRQSDISLIKTQDSEYLTTYFINCAGLHSDRVAELSGDKPDVRIIPFRGEYFKLKENKRHLVNTLIYPVPNPEFPFLGVHFTSMINGEVEAGPNAVFAFKREGYRKTDFSLKDIYQSIMWPGFRKVAMKYWRTGAGEFYRSFSKAAFTKALQELIPEIKENDLIPAEAGVRAQACERNGGLLDDFMIQESKQAIQVLNAPSPAATSSLSIGKTVAELLLKRY